MNAMPNGFEEYFSGGDDNKETFGSFGSASFQNFEKIKPEIKQAPAFDYAMLPDAFADYVRDVAGRMPAPPDYVATTLMVSLSAIVGRKVQIHPKQKDNWLVVPNLWGCIIGTPSAKKSPTMGDALRIVEKLETDAKKAYIPTADENSDFIFS